MMETTLRDAAAFFERTSMGKPAFDAKLAELKEWWKSVMPPAAT